ncbi:hypothetical protein [Marisediminicola senii]|uniref:hypothetical protein n=1 Tax=Marisediminicola senii TaxID=2711233 RepID=UPI0013EC9737|nr:hypothetical protein [Marisediminicola senii]
MRKSLRSAWAGEVPPRAPRAPAIRTPAPREVPPEPAAAAPAASRQKAAAPEEPVSDATERGTVERATQEGLLIAKSALTMDVKNHIILRALRDDARFDRDELAEYVRTELGLLSERHVGYARRMDHIGEVAGKARGPQSHGHDYRKGDQRALRNRAVVYRSLAVQLERLRCDDDLVSDVIETARLKAWEEIGSVIKTRLDWYRGTPPDPDYASQRGIRIADLKMIDIFALTVAPKRRR